MYDSDGSGELDQDEFIQVLKATGELAVAFKEMEGRNRLASMPWLW